MKMRFQCVVDLHPGTVYGLLFQTINVTLERTAAVARGKSNHVHV